MTRDREKAEPVSLSQIETKGEDRIRTEMEELDRVLGGGIVKGSLVLVGGDPGIGKSTLLLQMCRILGDKKEDIIYISGEESARQIKLRADRMGDFSDRITLLCETNLETIEEVIQRKKPDVAVIDSIQTIDVYKRQRHECRKEQQGGEDLLPSGKCRDRGGCRVCADRTDGV